MSELREIEPKLAAVREPRSGRNLLDPADPNPLTIDTTAGRNVRFRLAIENGPEGLMEMTCPFCKCGRILLGGWI